MSSFSIGPIASDVLEFLGPFDEPPLAAHLVIRAGFGVFKLVDRVTRHLPSSLGRGFGGGSNCDGSGFAQAKLDKSADGLGAGWAIFLS